MSRGILEAHRNGIVTSTTLLVNRAIPRAQVEELKASGLGVGVHLNLTLGTPVADPKRVPSLVDAEGRFVRDAREAAARAKLDEARIELGTQIDVFRGIMGRFPTHLDTHHHVGRLEPVLEVVLDFARALRRAREKPGRGGARAPRGLSASGRRTTSWASPAPEAYWSRERVLEHLAALPAGLSEFMTHPGYFDDELAYSRYGRQRETELAGLTDPDVRRAAQAYGIRLAHFGNC